MGLEVIVLWLVGLSFSEGATEDVLLPEVNITVDRRPTGDTVVLNGCLEILSCEEEKTAFIDRSNFTCVDKIELKKINVTQNCSVESGALSSKWTENLLTGHAASDCNVTGCNCSISDLSVVRGLTESQIYSINSSGFSFSASGNIVVNLNRLHYDVDNYRGEVLRIAYSCEVPSTTRFLCIKINGSSNLLLDKFKEVPKDETLLTLKRPVDLMENNQCAISNGTSNVSSNEDDDFSSTHLWIWYLCGGMGLFFVLTWIILIASIAKMVRVIKRNKGNIEQTISSPGVEFSSEKDSSLHYEGSKNFEHLRSITGLKENTVQT